MGTCRRMHPHAPTVWKLRQGASDTMRSSKIGEANKRLKNRLGSTRLSEVLASGSSAGPENENIPAVDLETLGNAEHRPMPYYL